MKKPSNTQNNSKTVKVTGNIADTNTASLQKKEQNRSPLKDTQKVHYAIHNRTKTQTFTLLGDIENHSKLKNLYNYLISIERKN